MWQLLRPLEKKKGISSIKLLKKKYCFQKDACVINKFTSTRLEIAAVTEAFILALYFVT